MVRIFGQHVGRRRPEKIEEHFRFVRPGNVASRYRLTLRRSRSETWRRADAIAFISFRSTKEATWNLPSRMLSSGGNCMSAIWSLRERGVNAILPGRHRSLAAAYVGSKIPSSSAKIVMPASPACG